MTPSPSSPTKASRTLRFGQTEIVYRVERSARRLKTVAVTLEPDGRVKVTAPSSTADEEIASIVRRKAPWILERLRQQDREDELPEPLPREMVSGETFLYLGRQYRLKVIPGGIDGRVRLLGRWLRVESGDWPPGPERASAVRESLLEWYREHASRRIPERVAALRHRVGREPSGILIRDQRRRWGSCDGGGVLRFNWRIVQAPRRLVDYVVVHELVHLLHADHTSAFWSALGRVMPDYEERREALRRLGRRLVW